MRAWCIYSIELCSLLAKHMSHTHTFDFMFPVVACTSDHACHGRKRGLSPSS